MSTSLTVQEVEQSLPVNLRGMATQAFTDKINNIVADPLVAEQVRDNFISYTRVLQEGRFKTDDYLNAVVYVSYKLMGKTNQDAWAMTFPQRYTDLVAKGTSSKDISSHVAAYAKNKMVNLILEQTMVPTWVLNADLHQKALNVQADLMINAQSEKVRSDAANSILTHLAKPKEVGPLINIGVSESDGLAGLKDLLTQVAVAQRDAITSGVSTKEIAGQKLVIEGESARV